MTYSNWQYFLAIESDLEKTTRYVEISHKNYHTYSIEFARIFLSAGSEVDVIAKDLCNRINPHGAYKNINDYRNTITTKYPKFFSMEVTLPRYSLSLKPWSSWGATPQENPVWWRSYNYVKHRRNEAFEEANLENTLNCIAGLFCLLLYCYQEEYKRDGLSPWTQLVSLPEQYMHFNLIARVGFMDF